MIRKLLISVLLCFFNLSFVTLAKEEKAKNIEHLVRADTGYEFALDIQPDETIKTSFETDPFLEFHVPESPDSEVLFFEFWGQAMYKRSSYEIRDTLCNLSWRLISDIIPEHITVWSSFGLFSEHNTNISGEYDIRNNRTKRNWKITLERESLDHWFVENKDTGEPIPDDEALSLLNSLIDEGFDVEVWTWGFTQGFWELVIFAIVMEVTRISK